LNKQASISEVCEAFAQST